MPITSSSTHMLQRFRVLLRDRFVCRNEAEMRGLQVSLNQTQKIRLQRALEKLESLSAKSNSDATVTVADPISVNYEDGILKGHGTSELDGEIVATLCGVVERVNKLVYVRALRARYKPETGDIIVGRVIEVAPKCWRLEINFSQDAVLMLSSMTYLMASRGGERQLMSLTCGPFLKRMMLFVPKFAVSSMMAVCTCKQEARNMERRDLLKISLREGNCSLSLLF